MAEFADIHTHILAGVDDGAKDDETMAAMLSYAYQNGTRAICLTPHYAPELFGENVAKAEAAFERASRYAAEHLPGLALYLGNEIGYSSGSLEALRLGKCHTMAGGRYVLVDFFGLGSANLMAKAVDALCCAGYIPVIAHVERYDCLWGKINEIADLAEKGAVLQVNVRSLLNREGRRRECKTAKQMLMRGLCDVIASDAHDMTDRVPELSDCYDKVASKYGEQYAGRVFYRNPLRILTNREIRR